MAQKAGRLWQRTKDAFSYIWNASNLEYTPLLATGPGFFVQSNTLNWSVNAVTDAYLDNDVIYQSLRVYLRKLKVAPLLLYKVTNDKEYRKYKNYQEYSGTPQHFINAKKSMRKAMDELESHSLLNLLNNPNAYQNQSMLFEAWYGYYKLTGNGYLYGGGSPDIGVNKGKYTELHVLESQYCIPIYSDNWRDPIAYYEYTIDGETLRIPKENICHLRDWNPLNKINGLSATMPGRKTIRTDQYNKTAQARSFENGGKATLLSSDSENEDFAWTQEQAELVDQKIRQKLQGVNNYGNIFSVTRPVKAQAIGDSVAEMKLIEAARANISRMSNLFGVDSVLIGDKEQATDNFVKAARKALVTDTVMPDLTLGEQQLNSFFKAFGDGLVLDYDTSVYPETQPDLELLVKVYGRPTLTENERRALFNYDDFEDEKLGQAKLIPTGYETIESVIDSSASMDNQDQEVEEAMKRYGY